MQRGEAWCPRAKEGYLRKKCWSQSYLGRDTLSHRETKLWFSLLGASTEDPQICRVSLGESYGTYCDTE